VGTIPASRFSITAKVGYGGILFADGVASEHTVTAYLDIAYQFTPNFFAHIGGLRSLLPVAGVAHYYIDNRIFLEAALQPIPVLRFNLLGTTDFYNLGDGTETQAYGMILNGDWTAANWLHVVAAFTFAGRVASTSTSPEAALLSSYNRIIGSAGVATFF
jgi:hypothetical protein